jgi:tRNA(Arg) A34 adenosine deaminase TadA
MTPQDLEHLRCAIAASHAASHRGDEPHGAALVDERGAVLLAAGKRR